MKRFSRILIIGAAALLIAGPAAPQDTPADKYAKEVDSHKAMAAGYIGNPNHPMDANMAVHCNALAHLAAAKAQRARTTGWAEEPAPAAPVIRVIGKTPSPSH